MGDTLESGALPLVDNGGVQRVAYYKEPASNLILQTAIVHILLVESRRAMASTCVSRLAGSHTFMFDELACMSLRVPCFVEPLTFHLASILFFLSTLQPSLDRLIRAYSRWATYRVDRDADSFTYCVQQKRPCIFTI